jgi:hypothetical protein
MVSKGQYFGFFFAAYLNKPIPITRHQKALSPSFPAHSCMSPSMLLLVQTEGKERKRKGNIPVAMLNIIL